YSSAKTSTLTSFIPRIRMPTITLKTEEKASDSKEDLFAQKSFSRSPCRQEAAGANGSGNGNNNNNNNNNRMTNSVLPLLDYDEYDEQVFKLSVPAPTPPVITSPRRKSFINSHPFETGTSPPSRPNSDANKVSNRHRRASEY